MSLEDGDMATCKNCQKPITYDKPYRSWYHSNTDLTAPDDMYCDGIWRKDDYTAIAEPVES